MTKISSRPLIGLGEAVERLGITNVKIWKLEEAVALAHAKRDAKTAGRLTWQIRLLNRDRYAWRNYLDEHFGDSERRGDAVKMEHLSIGRDA